MAETKNKASWIDAAIKEIRGMEELDTWNEVPMSSVPKEA